MLDAPPLAEAVCHDPRLRALKLVALASDDSLLPRGGARGFPHWALWMQRNTGWGADLLAYMAEGEGVVVARVVVSKWLWTGVEVAAPGPVCGWLGRSWNAWPAGQPGPSLIKTRTLARCCLPACRHLGPADGGGGAADGQRRRV